MRPVSLLILLIVLILILLPLPASSHAAEPRLGTNQTTADWRAEKRFIDLHQHIDSKPDRLARTVKIMDSVGLGLGVNLSGGTVTSTNGSPSAFERNKKTADELFPGRFLYYMNLDYSGWDEPDFAEKAVKQVGEGFRLGAAGLKEFKRLGLYLKDKSGNCLLYTSPSPRDS